MRDLITENTVNRLWFACLALITLAVMGGIAAAAVKADHEFKRQALINQERNVTWKQ